MGGGGRGSAEERGRPRNRDSWTWFRGRSGAATGSLQAGDACATCGEAVVCGRLARSASADRLCRLRFGTPQRQPRGVAEKNKTLLVA